MSHRIFITGGTGYIGHRLIPLLVKRGHEVTALARKGSETNLPAEGKCVVGDPLLPDSYTSHVRPADTFVHLVGVSHPSPAKAAQFREIDFVSVQVAIKAARDAGIAHFVYVSVAHPAPLMKAYLEVRTQCEELVRASGIPATFLRPWYVLGPDHRWPYLLLPFYWVCERLPATRESARRLGLVKLPQMLRALVWAVEHPGEGIQILEVPQIRQCASTFAA